MPGPQPKPAAINELAGNPGKRPIKKSGKFPNGSCQCPDWLNPVGVAKWNELLAKLSPVDGLVKPAFEDALAMYCEAFEEFIEARKEIEREGATCESEKGGAYQHPAVGRKNKAIARMKQFGALFGMSPVGESELPAGSGAAEQQEDRLTLLKYERQKANGRTNK